MAYHQGWLDQVLHRIQESLVRILECSLHHLPSGSYQHQVLQLPYQVSQDKSYQIQG